MDISRYGHLTKLALLVECLAPGQNCIACIICMVKFPEKGDFYSQSAKVSILLLLYAVAHGVEEKKECAS